MLRFKNKGKEFEAKVGNLLDVLQSLQPESVRVIMQPQLELYNGEKKIPDFELQYDLLHQEERYLIECQDRKRSSTQIAEKIKYIKGLSNRNRFIFVHAQKIPKATEKVLADNGVLVMSYLEFASFVTKLELQIRMQPKNYYSDLLLRLFPPGKGPDDCGLASGSNNSSHARYRLDSTISGYPILGQSQAIEARRNKEPYYDKRLLKFFPPNEGPDNYQREVCTNGGHEQPHWRRIGTAATGLLKRWVKGVSTFQGS